MAGKREILVHTMKETETDEAEAILGPGCVRDGKTIVRAWADPAQIRKLRLNNLIVESVEQASAAAAEPEQLFRASATLDWGALESIGAPVAPDGRTPAIPSRRKAGTFALKLNGPETDFSEVLAPISVHLDRSSINGFAVARLRPRQRDVLEADERIEVLPFNHSPVRMPQHALSEREREAVAPTSGEVRDFDLIAHSPGRRPEIETWVHSKGAALTLLGTAEDRVRIRIVDTSPLLDEADELDAVHDVRPVPGTFLCLDHVRPLVGLPATAADPPLAGPGGLLDGAGEVVGIIDGAVDEHHPDLAGRVRTIFGSATPPSAHGTHVAGIIAGDGTRSGGKYRGIAPAATLSVQGLAVRADGGIDLDVNFGAMLERSYQDGARILNLSLDENGPPAFYSHRANEIDAFAIRRPDMLIVIAAGNRATAAQPQDRAAGHVGLESVSAPGVAKNALTVGASCSDRARKGHAADWASYDSTRFASPPTGGESVSGDASRLAAFSGRGWSQESRIKPDLVAPGTNIVAARAAGSPNGALWGRHSPGYLYSGGTSMAAPVVAGCAALVRQYYRQRGHVAPSSALLRATLANGAVWLNGAGAANAVPKIPANACANLDQGFGRVDVRNALGLARPGDRLCYVDVHADGTVSHTLSQGTAAPFSNEADERRYLFLCEGEGEVDIAFCYLDPEPGSGGVAFRVQVQPQGGKRRLGNDCAIKRNYPAFGDALDRTNELQVVRLGRTSGKVEVQIRPLALMDHKVGFALVVRGPVEGGLLHAY
ncbi:MAG TPA: S8 family serine peptidase [Allosphingosinicella sp.]|nr:S8 family serine peptidase [Allosphingosinicella sp.]